MTLAHHSAGATKTALGALFAGILLLAVSTPDAKAAPSPTVVAAADTIKETTLTEEPSGTALTSGLNEERNCERSRKRLWVESEGWIVRRVTTCR